MKPKVCTVVGARPQFIKAAAVTPVLRRVAEETLLHTGQHYDYLMSQVFFDQLGIPVPDVNLGAGSGSHGSQTAAMLSAIERVLLKQRPACVLVYGDTNSTLAGALAAVKLRIPVVHVEAGLRVYDLGIPEEVNRVLTDHASSLLCAPTRTAAGNLRKEGLQSRTRLTGDVAVDVLKSVAEHIRSRKECIRSLGLEERGYIVLTLHRPGNVDDPTVLRTILGAVREVGYPVLFPVHPRTRERIKRWRLEALVTRHPVIAVEPLSFLDMVAIEACALRVLTDSGGVQKECYLLGVPCVTLRSSTEWQETVDAGWNYLAGSDPGRIATGMRFTPPAGRPPVFGDGSAAEQVVEAIMGVAEGPLAEGDIPSGMIR